MKRDIERQQKELDEKKRELEKSVDTTFKRNDSTYRFKQEVPAINKVKTTKVAEPVQTVETNELLINPMTMPLTRLNW